jgi:hypothetical protein
LRKAKPFRSSKKIRADSPSLVSAELGQISLPPLLRTKFKLQWEQA